MKLRLSPLARLSVYLVSAAALGLGLASSASSCTKNDASGFGGGGGAGGGSGSSGDAVNHGKELYAEIDQQMYAACGMCHDIGGFADRPFLAGPDHYHSIVSWPGIVTKDPTQSKLETIPVMGPQHTYAKLDSADLNSTLYPKVKAWLAEEAKALSNATDKEAGKGIEPFTPIIGFNAIYLDALGDEFTGMAVTFNADQLNDNTLTLADIEVHPTAKLGVHIVHPLFVVGTAAGPDPDPVDSFSNVDTPYPPGQAAPLGPGTLILTNWAPDAKLSLAFEKLETIMPEMNDGGGSTGDCKDVNSFNTNAAPLLKNNCTACHGGSNPQAKGAVDMSALGSDPATTCAQVKNRVNPADPPSSQLFITTDPGGNAAHPFKFGGDANKFNSFKMSISQWVSAEK